MRRAGRSKNRSGRSIPAAARTPPTYQLPPHHRGGMGGMGKGVEPTLGSRAGRCGGRVGGESQWDETWRNRKKNQQYWLVRNAIWIPTIVGTIYGIKVIYKRDFVITLKLNTYLIKWKNINTFSIGSNFITKWKKKKFHRYITHDGNKCKRCANIIILIIL